MQADPAIRAAQPVPWWRRGSVFLLVAIAVGLAGCQTTSSRPAAAAMLAGVLRGGQVVAAREISSATLQVVRNGATVVASPEMGLAEGDSLVTGADTVAVLAFPRGARAYLYPNTRVRIGSLIQDFGKVFVKVQGAFKVKTTFVTAGSEGTEYWVDVSARDQVRVVVAESVVLLASNVGGWPSRRLRVDEQAWLRGAGSPEIGLADRTEISREREWVRSIDRLVPPKSGFDWRPFAVGAGFLGAEAMSGRDSDSRRPPERGDPATRAPESSPPPTGGTSSTTTTPAQPRITPPAIKSSTPVFPKPAPPSTQLR